MIAEDVVLGENVELGWHAAIHAGTTIGAGCVIEDNVVIGRPPVGARARSSDAAPEATSIGAGSRVGSNAVISAGASLGPDCLVGPLASVGAGSRLAGAVSVGTGAHLEHAVKVGRGSRIGTGAHLAAHSEIGDEVLLGPGVVVESREPGSAGAEGSDRAHSRIRDRATVGAGVVLIGDVEIGQDAAVASGALVTKSVPPAKLVAGFPARIWRDVPESRGAHGDNLGRETGGPSAQNSYRKELA